MHFAFIQPPQPGSSWGSAEERHRRLCYVILALRYLYYVESKPAVEDHEYDLMERYLYWFESQYQITHANSPWRTVGSSDPESYPQTSIRIAESIKTGQAQKSLYVMEFTPEWKEFLHRIVIPE
jgi:NAD-dependent DNA ligase